MILLPFFLKLAMSSRVEHPTHADVACLLHSHHGIHAQKIAGAQNDHGSDQRHDITGGCTDLVVVLHEGLLAGCLVRPIGQRKRQDEKGDSAQESHKSRDEHHNARDERRVDGLEHVLTWCCHDLAPVGVQGLHAPILCPERRDIHQTLVVVVIDQVLLCRADGAMLVFDLRECLPYVAGADNF